SKTAAALLLVPKSIPIPSRAFFCCDSDCMKWSLEDVFQACILIYFQSPQGRKLSKIVNIFSLWFYFTEIHFTLAS
ncbi:MAG: hypothetical protein ACPHUG_00575, partial [Porticoccaceae bacterium]